MSFLLGCIADDYTGATDLASMLVRAGLRTVLWLGPAQPQEGLDAEAVVVALKSRSIGAADAVAQSRDALLALKRLSASRYYFKYCSTFDSTDSGNIGPVAEALMPELGIAQTLFCPAFPENGRTVYQGHLFVGRKLLNESGMERHPRHPMNDPNLLRVLRRQSIRRVGLVPFDIVSQGPRVIAAHISQLRCEGSSLLICDALADVHLRDLARAVVDWPLVTGGSALAHWLAEAYREAGLIISDRFVPQSPNVAGSSAILAGSCSSATNRQVARFRRDGAALGLEPSGMLNGSAAGAALDWASGRISHGPVLVYSTVSPEELKKVHLEFGEWRSALAVEQTMSEIACGFVELGVRRLVIAGGETAGAVLQSLGVQGLAVGPQIEPGVPWTESVCGPRLALALKSGNFGSDDFFDQALEMLP